MPESMQWIETRRRPQRVHIMCEVHVGNAIEKVDLPFMVAVLADLSGKNAEVRGELAERQFADVDQKNFNDYLASQAPQLAFTVPNRLGDPNTKLSVELNFKHMDDFAPEKVVRQIEPLDQLLKMRDSLKEVRDRAKSKGKLAALLNELIHSPEKRAALTKEMGLEPPASPPSQS
jgi:type VI secretion system protein ImpB